MRFRNINFVESLQIANVFNRQCGHFCDVLERQPRYFSLIACERSGFGVTTVETNSAPERMRRSVLQKISRCL